MSDPFTKSGQMPSGTRPTSSNPNQESPHIHPQQDNIDPLPPAFHPKIRLTDDPSEAPESGDRKTSGNV